MRKCKKTLFYIELPPPIHGMTYINNIIFNNLKENENYIFCNINYSSNISDIGKKSILKIWKNLVIIFSAWVSFFRYKPNQVYIIISASKFGIVRDFMILFPSILFNSTRILHLHGFTYFDIYQNSKLYRFIFNILSKNAKIIVLCKKHKYMVKNILNKNSYVLNNALQSNVKSNPKNLNISHIKLLYISNISESKGIFDLMNSIKNINNVTLTIAGNFWRDERKFRELLKTMEDKVNFVGFADELKKDELLRSHDIFCIPSKLSEGSPVSIIEAMAYGLPVIGTDKGCIKEMINNCGYVVEGILNSDKMREAIYLISEKYEEYSRNAIRNYNEFYIKDIFIKRLSEIICAE